MSSVPNEATNVSENPNDKFEHTEKKREQTSTSDILTKFLEETTLHGTKYVSHTYGNPIIR